MEPFLGQIMAVGFNFAPRGWSTCDGQLLPISSNTALFSLLGTAFGGDGRTTFALPDLRGRISKHVGTGAGLNTVTWGQRGGAESIAITVSHMPSHNHTSVVQGALGNTANPNGALLATDGSGDAIFSNESNRLVNMNSAAIGNTGGGVPFDNRNPYLGVYHNIALQGIFPSRS